MKVLNIIDARCNHEALDGNYIGPVLTYAGPRYPTSENEKLEFNFRAVHVRLLTDKVTLGTVFIWELRCPCVQYSNSASDSFTCRMRGRTMSELDAAVSHIVPRNWTTTSSLLASAEFTEDMTPRNKHAVRVN